MCAPVFCETNGDQGFLAREIVGRGVPARGYRESQNKFMKISNFLRKWWGNVVFLRGTDRAYIDQIMAYDGMHGHDDAADSAACVCGFWDGRE